MFYIFIIALLAGFGAIGDYCLKKGSALATSTLLSSYFIAGFFIFALSAFGWFYIFQHVKMSSVGVIYGTTTAIILTIVGVFVFQEKLYAIEVIGLVFGILSIALLSRFI